MSRPERTRTLFVAGFPSHLRARDLAWEFERFGRLVRCDIPAPKFPNSKVYAFVEFEDTRDAEDAYFDMHGKDVAGGILTIQWAKNAPSATWRHEARPVRDERPPVRGAYYNVRDRDDPYARSPRSPRDDYRDRGYRDDYRYSARDARGYDVRGRRPVSPPLSPRARVPLSPPPRPRSLSPAPRRAVYDDREGYPSSRGVPSPVSRR